MSDNQNPQPTPSNPQAQIEQMKQSAYYTATYDAYMATLIEADKSILTISAGGVGLLVALLNIFQVKSQCDIVIYFIALAFFVVSIIASIVIFKRNNVVLMNMLMGIEKKDSILAILDYLNIGCCVIGILVTSYIGLSTGMQKLNSKPVGEVNKPVKTVQINTLNGNVILQGYSTSFTVNQKGKNNGK